MNISDIPHSASDAMNTTEQTHKFTEFPPNQADSDPEDDNIEDTEEVRHLITHLYLVLFYAVETHFEVVY